MEVIDDDIDNVPFILTMICVAVISLMFGLLIGFMWGEKVSNDGYQQLLQGEQLCSQLISEIQPLPNSGGYGEIWQTHLTQNQAE